MIRVVNMNERVVCFVYGRVSESKIRVCISINILITASSEATSVWKKIILFLKLAIVLYSWVLTVFDLSQTD